jgi:hypothetical protein
MASRYCELIAIDDRIELRTENHAGARDCNHDHDHTENQAGPTMELKNTVAKRRGHASGMTLLTLEEQPFFISGSRSDKLRNVADSASYQHRQLWY